MKRRSAALLIFLLLISILTYPVCSFADQPNVVLMMCDDLGWGDTGFNGNTIIKTPHLDQIAKEGARLTHFYSIGPVCSPTRASFLTGRHYYRMGIYTANFGHLPGQEHTVARMFKREGYATGHFGKWHLGTLNPKISAKGEMRRPADNFAPPWERDYDASFVTESAVATWNPARGQRAINNPYYENGQVATQNLDGCDSRVLMDRAIPFIQDAVQRSQPFIAVIWFHAPHEEVVAGPEYLAKYPGHGDAAHYYGCVTAVDDQVGRLRGELNRLGVADNTALFFCSDNGPEGKKPAGRRAGTTGGFKGRKRSVHEGGIRVPALALWPNHIPAGSEIDVPMSVLDYLPTLSEMTGGKLYANRTLDGESILPILTAGRKTRRTSIPFRFQKFAGLVSDRFKLIIESTDDRSQDQLYDLLSDPTESKNLAKEETERVQRMRDEVMTFLKSAQMSHHGDEYDSNDFQPVDAWKHLPGSGGN